MSGYQGDFTTANTLVVFFSTFDSNDPSASVIVSDFVVGDIAIYKNGSVTQRSSVSGYTLLDTDGINFDSLVGVHGFSIDLSDDDDAGFYATGAEYSIIVGPVTVDGATITFEAASFSIERTGGAIALLKGTNSLSGIETKIDAVKTETALIVGDTDELQQDNVPGTLSAMDTKLDTIDNFLDTEIAAILAAVDTEIAALVTAIITNATGVDIAADVAAVKTTVDAIPTTAMRGTDGANTTTPPSVAQIQAELEENGLSILDTLRDRLTATRADNLDELGAANIPADVDTLLTRCTEARLSELDAGTGGKAANQIDLIKTAADAIKALLDTTTMSELASGAPPATPAGLIEAVMYVYMQWRNGLIQTSTERRLRNDAGTVIAKATMSDDGTTFDSGEMGAP